MEQLTLEQASTEYSLNCFVNNPDVSIKTAFKAGAEWQKEQLKSKWEAMSTLMENGLAKDLVNRVAAQLLQD